MAPVFKSNSASTTTIPLEAGISALTTAGESLFMCSTKEGHTCYHACRGHGKYPLWSDDTYMVDDVDEEEEEEKKTTKAAPAERRRAWDDMDDSSEYSGEEEEWLEEENDVDDSAFWQEIQDSVARHRARQNQRIHYAASDLRFLLTDGESTANTDVGPIVGVITTKPPPEYVWYMVDDDNWMRGSIPEKLSEEQDGAYFRYQYHTWDRIPNSDVRDSSSEGEYDDEVSVTEEPGPYDNVTDFEDSEAQPRHSHCPNQGIIYSASDLRFLLKDGESMANNHGESADTEGGPIVGVITTKPPPEYVWYMVDDDNWMRGSNPEKLSEEQDGAYFRYKYHTWVRIPNSDVQDSYSDGEYDDEVSVTEEPGPYDNVTDFEVSEEDEEEEEEEDVDVEESLQEVEVVTDNGDGQALSDLADLAEEKQQTTS